MDSHVVSWTPCFVVSRTESAHDANTGLVSGNTNPRTRLTKTFLNLNGRDRFMNKRSSERYALANRGINGVSRLDGPPAAHSAPSRIVPAGRRSPHACGAGPRAARSGLAALATRVVGQQRFGLAGRGHVVGPSLSLGQAPSGRVRPKAKRRGEPVGGCGTPANEPALSTPLRGGQRSHPRAGAGVTIAIAQRWSFGTPTLLPKPYWGGHDPSELSSAEHLPVVISTVPKSSRSLVQTACRTRGGLAVLGRNTDMRRHGVLRPKTAKPQPLRGRGA